MTKTKVRCDICNQDFKWQFLLDNHLSTKTHLIKGQLISKCSLVSSNLPKNNDFFKGFLPYPHCNPVQGRYRARTGFSLWSFSHREKPVFITGNTFSHCRDHVFITGNFLWELLHREIPVVITGNGFAVFLC